MDTSIARHPPGEADRRVILRVTLGLGAVIAVGAAIPFISSMAPSERALSEGAPVDLDLNRIAAGDMISVAWRGKPVWILHRTPAMIESLRTHTDMLADPRSERSEQPAEARNDTRSINPEFGVMTGICTHLGCIPNFRNDLSEAAPVKESLGGYYCPCHGSLFDLAGRVFKNVPAPINLIVPPHKYLAERLLRIGE